MISQTAEYALRSVIFLGGQNGQPMTTRQIATGTRVPAGYLSKVLQELGRAGLVDARRGLRGGYVLARPRDELTILDVINAVDPLKRITECPLGLEIHQSGLCALHRRLSEGIGLMESLFRETTIEQLVAQRTFGENPLCPVPLELEVAAAPAAGMTPD